MSGNKGRDSDFRLLVSVQGGDDTKEQGSSGKDIYDDLKSIFQKIEDQITTKVAVGMDENSLKKLQSQLSDIKNSFTFKINSDTYSKEIEKALKKYNLLKESSKDSKKIEDEKIAAQTAYNKKILEQEDILKRIAAINKVPKSTRTAADNSKLASLRRQRDSYYGEYKTDKTGTTLVGWEKEVRQQAKAIANATAQAESTFQSGAVEEATIISKASETVVKATTSATAAETDAIQNQATEVKKSIKQLTFDDFTEANATSIAAQSNKVVDGIETATQSEIGTVKEQANELEKAADVYGEAVKTLSSVISLNPDNNVVGTTKVLEGVQTGNRYTEKYAAQKNENGTVGDLELQRIDKSNKSIEDSMRRINSLFLDVTKKKDALLSNNITKTFADELSQELSSDIQKIQTLQDALGNSGSDKFSSLAGSPFEDLHDITSASEAVEKIDALLKSSTQTVSKINSVTKDGESSMHRIATSLSDVVKTKEEFSSNNVSRTFAGDLTQELDDNIQKIQLLKDALESTDPTSFSSFATSENLDLRDVTSASTAVEKIDALLKSSDQTISKINSSTKSGENSLLRINKSFYEVVDKKNLLLSDNKTKTFADSLSQTLSTNVQKIELLKSALEGTGTDKFSNLAASGFADLRNITSASSAIDKIDALLKDSNQTISKINSSVKTAETALDRVSLSFSDLTKKRDEFLRNSTSKTFAGDLSKELDDNIHKIQILQSTLKSDSPNKFAGLRSSKYTDLQNINSAKLAVEKINALLGDSNKLASKINSKTQTGEDSLSRINREFSEVIRKKGELSNNGADETFAGSLSQELDTNIQKIELLQKTLKSTGGNKFSELSRSEFGDLQGIDSAKSAIEKIDELIKNSNQTISEINKNVQAVTGSFGKTISAVEDVNYQYKQFERYENSSNEFIKSDFDKVSSSYKQIASLRESLGDVSGKSFSQLSPSEVKIYKELSIAMGKYSANVETLTNRVRTEVGAEKELETTIRDRANSLTQSNKILSEARKYFATYRSGIQSNVTVEQKWIGLLDKLRSGKYENNINGARAELAMLQTQTSEAGAEIMTLRASIKKLFKDHFGSISATTIIGFFTSSLRKVYENVLDIDTAMTELKKVTNLTTAEYKKFGIEATTAAKEVGATIADTINSAADFARLGYDAKDALDLSEAALVYKNVGDGIDDISIASESLISTMKAFGLQASDSMSIVDKFNEVGNNYAISSVGIGEALQRSAASLSTANNTLDESIALVTAANTVVQDPEAVGTAMKTISMYLRAAKTEAEEAGIETDGMVTSVSKLRDEIKGLTGVDIMLDDKNFKSTYQILKEISKVWDSLTDTTRANLQQKLAGKQRGNILASIISNFGDAEKALKTSQNSAGSALAENEKQLDSIQGHITKLTTSLEELSQGIMSAEAPKFIFDLLKGIVDLLNSTPSVLGTILGLVTAIAVQRKTGTFLESVVNGDGIKKFKLFGRSADELKTTFVNLFKGGQDNLADKLKHEASVLETFTQGFKGIKTSTAKADYIKKAFADDGSLAGLSTNAKNAALEISNLSKSYKNGTAVVDKFKTQQAAANKEMSFSGKVANIGRNAFAAFGTAIASVGISLAISAITGLVTDFIENKKKLEAEAAEAAKKVNEISDAMSETVVKFREYRQALSDDKSSIEEVQSARSNLLAIQRELIETYDLEAGSLNLVNGELERQAQLLLQVGENSYRKNRELNESGYQSAVKEMTTQTSQGLGKTGAIVDNALDLLPYMKDDDPYKIDSLKLSENIDKILAEYGVTDYTVSGTPAEIYDKLGKIYNELKETEKDYSDSDTLDLILATISETRNNYKKDHFGEDEIKRDMFRQFLAYDSDYKNDYKNLSVLEKKINAAVNSDDLKEYDELMSQFVADYQTLIDTANANGDTAAAIEFSEIFDTSALSDFRGLFSDSTSEVAGLSASLVTLKQSFKETRDGFKGTLDNISKFQNAIQKVSNGERLTISEINELIELDDTLASKFTKTGGGYSISISALVTAQDSLSADTKASIEKQAEEAADIITKYLAKVDFIKSLPGSVPTSAIEGMLKANGLWNDLTPDDYTQAENIKDNAEILVSELDAKSDSIDPSSLYEKTIEDWKRKNDYDENDADSRKAFVDYASAQARTYFYGAGSLYQSAENYKNAIESVAKVEQKSLEDSYSRGLISYEEYRKGIEELSKKYTDADGYYILGSQFVSDNVDYDKAYEDAITKWQESNGYDTVEEEKDYTKRNDLAAAMKSFNEKYFGKDSGNYNPTKLKENYDEIEKFEKETLELRISNEKKFLEERNKSIEDATKERTDAIDEEIDKLKDEQSELEAINEEEEQRLQLIKDRQAVEDAKANRNQLVFANGGYGYEVDQAAVEEALSAVKNDEEAIAKKASDNRIAEKEAEKEAIESEKEEKTGANDKLIEALDNMTEEAPQHDAGIISDAITKSLKDEQLSVDDVTKIGEQLKSGNEGLEAVKNGTYVIDTSDLVAQIEKLQNSESGSSGFSAINQLKDAVSKSKGDVYNNSKVSNTYAVSIPAVSISLPGNTPIEMATEFASRLGEALSQKLATIVQ